jgi:hypothetical protein
VLVLGVGGFFFSVLGMVVGIVLVWISIAWRTRDKLVATAVSLACTLVPALLWVLAVASGTGGVVVALGPFAMPVVFGGTSGIGGLLGALYLAARLPAATPAEHRRRRGLRICLVIAVCVLALIALVALRLLAGGYPTT